MNELGHLAERGKNNSRRFRPLVGALFITAAVLAARFSSVHAQEAPNEPDTQLTQSPALQIPQIEILDPNPISIPDNPQVIHDSEIAVRRGKNRKTIIDHQYSFDQDFTFGDPNAGQYDLVWNAIEKQYNPALYGDERARVRRGRRNFGTIWRW